MTEEEEVLPVMAAMTPPEQTETEKGISWFKLVFGFFYLVVGIFALARFFYLRNIFEIRARSPYLVTLNGLALLGSVGVFAYSAESAVIGRFPINPERAFIAAYCVAWGVFASFWCRVLRLALAYCPRVRRKVPWLMSERLLVSISFLFCLAGGILPWYRSHTINGPGSTPLVAQQNKDDRMVWTWASLVVSLCLVPVMWRVDDIFSISRELIAFIALQFTQAVATKLASKYASEGVTVWINRDNVPVVGAILVFGLSVIDPLRRLMFNPLAKTYPAFARADAARREALLTTLKKKCPSGATEESSFGDTGSACESDIKAFRRRKWSYENLAAVPKMAVAFRAFSFRALCQESVLFLEEVSKYERDDFSVSSADDWGQWSAFCVIVARFIDDGSPDEINISYGDKKEILDLSRAGAETFEALGEHERRKVFGESYVEIRYMLESNLLTRFLETREFMGQEANVPVATPASAARRRQRRASSIHNRYEADLEGGGGGGGGGVGWDVDQQQQHHQPPPPPPLQMH